MSNGQNDFEKLYSDYNKLVYNTAMNYLQNIEDAEEVTQDVFVQVFNSMNEFKGKSSIKTWIYRITISKCLDFTKHKNAVKRWFIFGKKRIDESLLAKIPNFEHPGVLLENQESATILFGLINMLPENQKTAFLLSKADDLGNGEIAAIMQMSISAVESLIFRAKANLRKKLEEKFSQYRKN